MLTALNRSLDLNLDEALLEYRRLSVFQKVFFFLWLSFSLSLPFSIAVATVFLISIIVIFSFQTLKTRDFRSLKPSSALEWSVAAFLGWVVVSTCFSTDFWRSADGLRTEYVALILFLFVRTIKSDLLLKIIATAFVISSALTAVVVLRQYFDNAYIAEWGRPYGMRSNPLTTAEGFLFVWALVLPRLNFWKPFQKWGDLIFFLLLTGGIVGASCRGPWVAALLMLIVFEVLRTKRIPWISLLFTALIVSVSLKTNNTYLSHRVLSIVDTKHDISNNERFYMWRIATKMIARKPVFGYGLKTVKENFKKTEVSLGIANPQAWGEIHNSFLQIAVQHGIIGLILFLAVFVHAFRLFWRNRADPLCQGLLLALVGFLVAGFTESIYNDSEIAMTCYLFLGMLLASDGFASASLREVKP